LKDDFLSLGRPKNPYDMIHQKDVVNHRAGRYVGIASVMLLIVIIVYAVYECQQ
jgi:hypothetical protein